MEPNQNADLPAIQSAAVRLIDKDGNVNLNQVTPDDVTKYSALNRELNPADANSILNYGASVQATMERYSNQFLASVRTQNAGEVGGLINELLSELNYIDVDELEKSGFTSFLSKIPFLKKLVFDAKKLFQKYDLVINNVDKITNKVKAGRLNALKDNSALQTMFDSNVEYIKQMEELIISGQLKHKELSDKLAEMDANPSSYNDYEIADLRDFTNRLDKRLADMKIVRFIMLQSLAQIRVVQNNNTSIAEKAQIDSNHNHTGLEKPAYYRGSPAKTKGQRGNAEKISDTTNTILQKNADMLKQNSIEVARENEKTVVSLDTLKRTTQSLIETLNEVKQIHEQGTQNRKVLSTELQTLETELRKNVTNVS